jgi:hypothetical protein
MHEERAAASGIDRASRVAVCRAGLAVVVYLYKSGSDIFVDLTATSRSTS